MSIMLFKAYLLARKAHKGQVDKAGKKYIKHPLRVSKRCKTKKAKIVAMLHDVVEDTKYDLNYIEHKFGKDIASTLNLVTHPKDMSYEDYIDRMLSDKTAIEVKLSDLLDNMNVFRMNKDDITLNMLEKYKTYAKTYIKLLDYYKHD